MNTRLTALAAATACAVLLSGCNRKDTDDTTGNVPPPATVAAPAPATTAPPPAPMTSAMPPAGSTSAMPPAASTTSGGMATTTGSAMGTEPATMGMATGAVTAGQFYSQALSGSRKEAALSQLVAKQSSNADVKRLADAMARDHKALDTKLVAAAGSSAPPAPADSTLTADLQGKTGADLDRAYVDKLLSDHQQTIAMFENAAKNADTAAARKLASDTLPALREHLKSVQDVQQKLGSM